MSHIRKYIVAALSICLTICVAGCPKKEDADYKKAEKNGKLKEGGDSHKPGPHGGQIVDLGNHKFRGEIVFKEEDPREMTIYLLDHNKDVPVFSKDNEIVVHFKLDGKMIEAKLPAAPQSGDKEGMTSRFQAKGDKLPKELHDEHDLEGGHFNVHIMVKDKPQPFSVTIEGHDHDHDDHDHKKK